MKKVDAKFYRGDDHPEAFTVGQLIAVLSELPEEMSIESGFGEGVRVIVYNYGMDDAHVELDEIDRDD